MIRMRALGWFLAQLLLLSVAVIPNASAQRRAQDTATPTVPPATVFPSYNPSFPPPPGWNGHVFALSQNYPAQPPAPEARPWEALDFHQQPLEYLRSVLAYALE